MIKRAQNIKTQKIKETQKEIVEKKDKRNSNIVLRIMLHGQKWVSASFSNRTESQQNGTSNQSNR